MQGVLAGLPSGIPGIGLEIEGAVQHAPQPGRHSIRCSLKVNHRIDERAQYHLFCTSKSANTTCPKGPSRVLCRDIFDIFDYVGRDGETHQGIFDISFMSAIPNLTMIAPKDKRELEEALEFAMDFDAPVAVRFARGSAYISHNDNYKFEYGKSEIIKQGRDIAIIAV